MSKWINKELFDDFQKEKVEEKDQAPSSAGRRIEMLWDTPQMGTVDQAKTYEGRFIPDPKGKFYKKYCYHMWKSGDNWIFVLCPKTGTLEDFKNNYCPFCSVTSKLYKGSDADAKQAYQLKRKEKFAGNWFVVKDPRDAERDDENKVVGKVKLYEFPSKVEMKLKNEITDKAEGYGYEIFDPGEDGRNFIIKVLATKPDKEGKQWPDYSSSVFSRTQSAIGDDAEIKRLLESCVDLDEYVDAMKIPKDKMVEILKNEFLWELVDDEAKKFGYKDTSSKEPKKEEPKKEEPKKEEPKKEEPKKEEKEEEVPWDTEEEVKEEVKSESFDDDELLKELEGL